MFVSSDFLNLTLWLGLATLGFAGLTILAFVSQWRFRFQLVGVTGFFAVLVVGTFGLSLGLFQRIAVEDVKFEGEGCAISMASADLMADSIRGQTIEAALAMVDKFQAMMRGETEFPKEHRKLNAMQGVAQFPVRIKCANLTWHALRAALEASENGELRIEN